MALNELGVVDTAPAPIPAPIPVPAPATIPMALKGWSPSTITTLEAAGISEVPTDQRELVYVPAPAPPPMLVSAPGPTAVPVPMSFPAPTTPVPVRAPGPAASSSASWDAAVDRYLAAPRVAVPPCPAHRSRDERLLDLEVHNILGWLEDLNNGVPDDDNTGAARRRHCN